VGYFKARLAAGGLGLLQVLGPLARAAIRLVAGFGGR